MMMAIFVLRFNPGPGVTPSLSATGLPGMAAAALPLPNLDEIITEEKIDFTAQRSPGYLYKADFWG